MHEGIQNQPLYYFLGVSPIKLDNKGILEGC